MIIVTMLPQDVSIFFRYRLDIGFLMAVFFSDCCHLGKLNLQLDLGQIHLSHLWIRKYFTDDSSIFHYKVFFLHFLQKMKKNHVKEIYR